jgi:hypothetical protein
VRESDRYSRPRHERRHCLNKAAEQAQVLYVSGDSGIAVERPYLNSGNEWESLTATMLRLLSVAAVRREPDGGSFAGGRTAVRRSCGARLPASVWSQRARHSQGSRPLHKSWLLLVPFTLGLLRSTDSARIWSTGL